MLGLNYSTSVKNIEQSQFLIDVITMYFGSPLSNTRGGGGVKSLHGELLISRTPEASLPLWMFQKFSR